MADDKLFVEVQVKAEQAIKQTDTLQKELDSLKKTMDGSASTKINESFNSTNQVAKKLQKTILSLAAAYVTLESAKTVVKTAADIEAGFLGVEKTAGLAKDEMEKLKEQILDMSTTMAGVSIAELQSIAEIAGQLGVKGRENIAKFTETVAKVAVTTDLSAEEAAISLAKISDATGVPISEVDRLASSVNELSNTTTATAGQIVSMSQRIAGVGSTIGLTVQEINAISASMSDMGFEAERGGTAMQEILLKMLSNTKGFAEASGVETDKFAKLWKEKPIDALDTFVKSLGKMNDVQRVATLKELKLTGASVTEVLLKMANNTGKLQKATETSNKAFKENVSIQKEYETFSKSLNAQMVKVANTLKVLATKIGKELLPKLKELAKKFADWVKNLDDKQIKKFGETLSNVASLIGDIASAIGSFVGTIASFVSENAILAESILGVVVALKAMDSAIAGSAIAKGSILKGISSLKVGLQTIIGMASPWGLAFGAMGIASTLVFNKMVSDMEQVIKKNDELTQSLDGYTDGMQKISDLTLKAMSDVKEFGGTSQKTYNELKTAIEGQIASLEKQISSQDKNKSMTQEQKEAYAQMGDQLKVLKGQYKNLPSDVKIKVKAEVEDIAPTKDISIPAKVEANTAEAQAKIDEIKGKSVDIKADDGDLQRVQTTAEKAISAIDILGQETANYGAVTEQSFQQAQQALNTHIQTLIEERTQMEQAGIQTEAQRLKYVALGQEIGSYAKQMEELPEDYTTDYTLNTDEAKKKAANIINEMESDPIQKDVSVNIDEAIKEIDGLNSKSTISLDVQADTALATTSIDNLKSSVSSPVSQIVEADTTKADAKVSESKKTIQSAVTFDVLTAPDTTKADRAREAISKPIVVPVVYDTSNAPNRASAGSTPINAPQTSSDGNLNFNLNVDGEKISTAVKNGAVSGVEENIFGGRGL